MSPTQAEAAIRAALPDAAAGALTLRLGDSTATIPYSQIERDYDMNAMLDRALRVGRDGSVIDELRTLNHASNIEQSVTWNNDALSQAVQTAVAKAEIAPSDAAISRDGAGYVVVPAQAGRSFDAQAAYSTAVAQLIDPSAVNASVSQDGTAVPPLVSTEQAQAAVDQVDAAAGSSLALAADGKSVTIPSDVLRGWVRLVPGSAAGTWSVAIESAPIAIYVDDLKEQVDVPFKNASYTFKGPGKAAVVPAEDGQVIEPAAAVATVVDALNARAAGTAQPTVNIAVSATTPEFSSAEAQSLVTRIKRLGRWTTHFQVSAFNAFGVNIRRPAQLINGTVVEPGAQFDFIDATAPFTKRNGYSDGAAIVHGEIKEDGVIGGGLCSASTTLFNAVARAGFQIDERHNHAFYISRYPVGLDATIWSNGRGGKSMKFTNDSQYPVLIKSSYSPGRVTFEVWGVPDGRKAKFAAPKVSKLKVASNYVVYTNDLPPGKIHQAEFRSNGFLAAVTRTVRDANGNIIHQETYYSDYVMVDGLYLVGRYPDDPRAGTKIPASEFVKHPKP